MMNASLDKPINTSELFVISFMSFPVSTHSRVSVS